MLDIKFVRANPDIIKEVIDRRKREQKDEKTLYERKFNI